MKTCCFQVALPYFAQQLWHKDCKVTSIKIVIFRPNHLLVSKETGWCVSAVVLKASDLQLLAACLQLCTSYSVIVAVDFRLQYRTAVGVLRWEHDEYNNVVYRFRLFISIHRHRGFDGDKRYTFFTFPSPGSLHCPVVVAVIFCRCSVMERQYCSCLQCFDIVGWASGRASGL